MQPFNWQDAFYLEGQLNEEERLIRDTARSYAQERLAPRVIESYAKGPKCCSILRSWKQSGQGR